jgi:adenylate kinase family enzyme
VRIFLVGSPKVGKTTLGRTMSEALGVRLVSSDDHIGAGDWRAQLTSLHSAVVDSEDVIVEGTMVARLLPRHDGEGRPELEPDLVLWLRGPEDHERQKAWRGMTTWITRMVEDWECRNPDRVVELSVRWPAHRLIGGCPAVRHPI